MSKRFFISVFLILSITACEDLNHSDSAANLNEVVSDLTDSFSSNLNNSQSSILVGTLGKNHINMEIKFTGNLITGTYTSPMNKEKLRLEGELDRQRQNQFEIREFDQIGNQVGAFRGNIRFNKKYEGEWSNLQGNMHAPFRMETTREVFMITSPTLRSNKKMDVEYRTTKIEAPEKQCQLIDQYVVIKGFDDPATERSINQLLKPAPLHERQASLAQCIEQLQDLQFEEGAKTENSVSINFINAQVMSVTRYQSEFNPETQSTKLFSEALNFDIQTGMALKNEELFVMNYGEALNRLIKQRLSEKYEHEWGLKFEGLKPEKTLGFYADRALLTFNPYELGDFAPGQIVLSLSYADMAGIINPNGPLGELIEGMEVNPGAIQAE